MLYFSRNLVMLFVYLSYESALEMLKLISDFSELGVCDKPAEEDTH